MSASASTSAAALDEEEGGVLRGAEPLFLVTDTSASTGDTSVSLVIKLSERESLRVMLASVKSITSG